MSSPQLQTFSREKAGGIQGCGGPFMDPVSRPDSPKIVIEKIEEHYKTSIVDRLDGLTVDVGDWWFNLRPSNTEPLLRLNIEANDKKVCAQAIEEVRTLLTQ